MKKTENEIRADRCAAALRKLPRPLSEDVIAEVRAKALAALDAYDPASSVRP